MQTSDNMELIIFGVGFGIFMGAGLFFMIILPALRERGNDEDTQ